MNTSSETVNSSFHGWPWNSPKINAFYERIVDGGGASFLVYLLFTAVVAIFILCTVNNWDNEKLAAYDLDYFMCRRPILHWIEDGYFKNGGLIYISDAPWRQTPYFYKSSPAGFLHTAHLCQRLSYWFTGQYSYRLAVWHNSSIVMLASALLGFLTMRLCLRIQLARNYALLLGLVCALVYQTFHMNLFFFWVIGQEAFFNLFFFLFLTVIEVSWLQPQSEGTNMSLVSKLAVFVSVFLLAHAELTTAFFMLCALVICSTIIDGSIIRNRHFLSIIVLPAALAAIIYGIQLKWIAYRFPEIERIGSTVMSRAGFDGSLVYYKDQFDVFFNKHGSYLTPPITKVTQGFFDWPGLLFGGLASSAAVALFYLKLERLRPTVLILAIPISGYLMYVAMFSQAHAIHTDITDVLIAFPCIVALFGILPAILERLTNQTGVFALFSFLSAFFYSMFELRHYAIFIPH